MTPSLSDLIERLERAEAGSRDLDFAIAALKARQAGWG